MTRSIGLYLPSDCSRAIRPVLVGSLSSTPLFDRLPNFGRVVLRLTLFAPVAVLIAAAAFAQGQPPVTPTASGDPPPPLPAEVLKNSEVIANGAALWQEQCSHCHGAKAYPGKAPKLQPHRYKPEFVWDRVHNGFRDMPAWKEVYTPEQEIAIVAYVLSDEFWP